jgi:hypothetical protein
MRKKQFHVRLAVDSIDTARQLAARFGFEYHNQPAIGLFLEFAIESFKKVIEGRYQWYDIEKETFVDLTTIAEEHRNSSSNN